LSKDTITVVQDCWVIDAKQAQTIRLFEIQNPDAEQCLVTYRATMKTEGLAGRAFLECGVVCQAVGSSSQRV